MVELAANFGSDTNARLSCSNDSVFCHLSGGYCDTSTELAQGLYTEFLNFL